MEEEKISVSSIAAVVREWIIYFVIVIGISYLIVTFVGQRTVVDGMSMYNTLTDQDNLIVDKISYRFHDPERFDIVVFRYQNEKDTLFIKRVIGLPGETIQIAGDDIYIDGQLLEEDYGYEPILDEGRAIEPITLGDNEYFVLGDNRNDSMDSREENVGNVNRDW
ncbi:MAG: signal peptidase I, partial [Lachnospiraceae bacterium]|nr:signal peptidase I [Lachnospiraceae bacterium]